MNSTFFRPSTYVRIIENGVGAVVGGVVHTAQNVGHAVGTEYEARKLLAMQQDIEDQHEMLDKMTEPQRAAYQAQVNEVTERFRQLNAQRIERERMREVRRSARAARRAVRS